MQPESASPERRTGGGGGADDPVRVIGGAGLRAVVVGCFLALGFASSPGFLFGFIGPQLSAELGTGVAELGVLIGVFFGSTGLVSLLSSGLVDRWGARTCLLCGVVAVGVVWLVTAGFATYPVLLAGAAVSGCGYALVNSGSNLAVAAVSDDSQRGMALTAKTAGVPAVSIGLALLGPVLVDRLGYRSVAVTLGVVCFAVALTAARVVPRAAPDRPRHGRRRLPAQFWRQPLAAFLFVFATQPLHSLLVSYLFDELGVSGSAAGAVAGVGVAVGLVAMLAVARGSDRLGGPRSRAALLSGLSVAGVVGLTVLVLVPTLPGAIVGSFLGLVVNLAGVGLIHALVVDRVPDSVGQASGLVLSGYYLGALMAPIVFALLVEATGRYAWSWAVCAVSLAVAAGLYARMRQALPGS